MSELGRSIRGAVLIGLAFGFVLACDKPGANEQAKDAEAKPKPSDEAQPPAGEPSKADPSAPAADASKPAPEQPAADEPEPAKPTTPALTLESLANSVERSDDPSATAWTHYKAKDYAAAIPYFAQATLAERDPWKHPYNLACAAAMAGNDDAARLGLEAAVARDREGVAAKARRDADLAAVRDKPWFEPTLTGAATEGASQPEPSAPPSSAAPLSKAQLAQLTAKLEAKHGVKVEVRASLTQPGEAGETLAWAIYSLSVMDECLKTSTKKQCLARHGAEPEDGKLDETKCNRESLIRARFSADDVTLDEPTKLQVPCKIARIREFDARDVDADGKAEIVVDVTGLHMGEGFRASEMVAGGRDVEILRLDDSKQFDLTVAWELSDLTPSSGRSRTYKFTDENSDGHPDLFIEMVEFEGDINIEFDDAMWVTSEPDEEMVGPHSSKLRYYDASKDEWGPEIAGP
jgi:hypothetical protein